MTETNVTATGRIVSGASNHGYVPYAGSVGSRSSPDIFGSQIENGPWLYVPPPILASVASGITVSNHAGWDHVPFLYGTPGNPTAAYWGVAAAVGNQDANIDAYWTWDLAAQGSPPISAFSFCQGTGAGTSGGFTLDGSTDGGAWSSIADAAAMDAGSLVSGGGPPAIIPISPPVAYRFVRLSYHTFHDASVGWYYGGTDPGLNGLLMWGGAVLRMRGSGSPAAAL